MYNSTKMNIAHIRLVQHQQYFLGYKNSIVKKNTSIIVSCTIIFIEHHTSTAKNNHQFYVTLKRFLKIMTTNLCIILSIIKSLLS